MASRAQVLQLCDRLVRWVETAGKSDHLTLPALKDQIADLVCGDGGPVTCSDHQAEDFVAGEIAAAKRGAAR